MRLINSEVRFLHKVDGAKAQRGFEQQRYVFQDDGTLTLSAFSVAGERRLTRDVILNLDRNYRPIDSYVRIHHGNRVEGSGWFRFSGQTVDADLWNIRKGLTRESVTADGEIKAFSGHPIACDVLMAAGFDRRSSDRIQHLSNIFMSSADHFGAVGPEIAPVQLEIEYVGAEILETSCGTFDTDHWRILPGNAITGHTHPGEDMWALRDSFVFIRAEIAAIGYEYELVSFRDVTA